VVKFHLKLITPERTLFEEEATQIIAPTKTGTITVLANHEPLVTQLSMGDLIVSNDKGEHVVIVYGGFMHITAQGVTILADSAEHIYEIDEQLAEEAVKKAEEAVLIAKTHREQFAKDEAILSRSLSNENNLVLAETQAELLKNLTRLRVYRKHRSHHNTKFNQ
jgi:F-type H+-transporting ATPase subunit epsilon